MIKIRCFISYCHEDTDTDSLDYLLNWLQLEAGQEYDILVDRKLPPGAALNEFMNQIQSVDAILLLLSPEYRRRILSRKGNVYDEFRQFMSRFQRQQEERLSTSAHDMPNYFEIIPILMAGDIQSSLPDELMHLLATNFVGLHWTKDDRGNFLYTTAIKQKYGPAVKAITDQLKAIRTIKTPDFKQRYRAYYKSLFLDVKAPVPRAEPALQAYQPDVFVETAAYKRIEQQAVYFVVGRKGSGKSTAAGAMAARQRHRYKGHVSIIANDFSLETVHSLFGFQQIRSDVRNVFDETKCFQLAWELFLRLCCMQILDRLDHERHLSDDQSRHMPAISGGLAAILGDHNIRLDEKTRNQFWFDFSFNRIVDFAKHCIESAREKDEYFIPDVRAGFRKAAFMEYALGREAVESFEVILSTCKKLFLVTLDGFDSAFDAFRRNTNNMRRQSDSEAQERTRFELAWLRSLLQLVIEIKEPHDRVDRTKWQDLIEFCITVPTDRFDEIERTERDGYVYINRDSHLDWSGLELCSLVTKRLEKLGEQPADNKKKPHERLIQACSGDLGFLPKELSFVFKGRSIKTHWFLYIMRHTFWRPREILMHLAPIIAAADELASHSSEITTETVRRIVSHTAVDVVRLEFIGEWESTFTNIAEVVAAFRGKAQVLEYEEVRGILNDVRFVFAAENVRIDEVSAKIQWLYEAGFLGVKLSSKQQEQFNITYPYAFYYFGEGRRLIRLNEPGLLDTYQYVIHPAFAEYVLDIGWDDLYA
jgi:energy-coupling factor transporter ATP-binding protein EcfA2